MSVSSRQRVLRRVLLPSMVGAAVVFIVALAGFETFARMRWGLGHPLLYDADPTIEYLQRPNQHLTRFGNHLDVNAFGMRSRDVSATKSDPAEFRVLVLGDSVVNGGAPTDQAALATSLLEADLAARLQRPVFVGNISAGSWGPPNLLAYVQRFGLFDADVVLVVLCSHDAADAPTFKPLDPNINPTEAPWCATTEFLTRYLPNYLPGRSDVGTHAGDADRLDDAAALATCADATLELFARIKAAGATPILIQHWELPEIEAGVARPGHDVLLSLADRAGVAHHDLGPAFRAAPGGPAPLFRDHIHPNAAGQRVLEAELLRVLESRGAPPDTTPHERPRKSE